MKKQEKLTTIERTLLDGSRLSHLGLFHTSNLGLLRQFTKTKRDTMHKRERIAAMHASCLPTGYGLSEEYPSGLRDLKLANKYVRLMRLIITCWHTQASAYVPVYSY